MKSLLDVFKKTHQHLSIFALIQTEKTDDILMKYISNIINPNDFARFQPLCKIPGFYNVLNQADKPFEWTALTYQYNWKRTLV